MRHLAALLATTVLGVVLWFAWEGFRIDGLRYGGLARELRGTWMWDLRYALVPAYAVAALWVAEKIAGWFPRASK